MARSPDLCGEEMKRSRSGVEYRLPTYCMFCGAYLQGGATVHREGCEILKLIKATMEKFKAT